MSIVMKIRRGEGAFWGLLKVLARRGLQLHVPVNATTRPLFAALYRAHVFGRESLIWARRFFWYEPLFRSQCAVIGDDFQMEELPYITGRGRIVLGNEVRLSGKPSFTFNNRGKGRPKLTIGDHTFIGHGCNFHVARSVQIGNHCLLAGGVRVQDFDGHPLDAQRRRAGEPTPPGGIRPIVLQDDVWVGAGAMILKGVTIGERAVIGAGAVVTRDVPPDTVVAGNPAGVVKQLPTPTAIRWELR